MSPAPSLSRLLRKGHFPEAKEGKAAAKELAGLQLRMLRMQQGLWQGKGRAVILFEGFDSSGKGGTIQRLLESVDPRGYRVHPIGPPSARQQGKHYLYRFWKKLPEPGTIAIFDRSWYGRVLVERVEKLAPQARWKAAFRELREFERMLTDDGVDLIKIFLAIDADEQLRRFEERLGDPYKQWKLTEADLEARKKWDQYVSAADDAMAETHRESAPWNLVPANHKPYARREVLKIVTDRLGRHEDWIEDRVQNTRTTSLAAELRKLSKRAR